MKNLYSVYRDAVKRLAAAECDSPEFDAQQLVEYCFGYNKTGLLMHSGDDVEMGKKLFFNECIDRRCNREPLQYILGMWDFHRFSFKVGEGVLIPRPETELLVDYALDRMRKVPCAIVFDLCCGSGCVGISLAKLFPTAQVYCVDISTAALEYTKKNKELLGADNVKVVEADVLDIRSLIGLPMPDLILSNPPYICSEIIGGLQPEIAFEPRLALDGGNDGLVFYRSLAEFWYPYINKGGAIAMECGEEQAKDILSLFVERAQTGNIIKDAAGLDRVVTVNR